MKLFLITLFTLAVIEELGCSNKSYSNLQHDNNIAIWSESIYLRGFNPTTGERLTDQMIYDYCDKLKKYNVTDIFLFAGPFQTDGSLPDYPFSDTAIHSIEIIKKRLPNIKILPWIGGIENKTVFLEDSLWVLNAIAAIKELISTLKVPGVHIDFEYILKTDKYLSKELLNGPPNDEINYGTDVNNFHTKLRKTLPKAFISSVVTATSRDTKPWKRKTSLIELNGLLENVNQLCFLYYDTNINDINLFQIDCDQLVSDIYYLKKQHPFVSYYIALGTFVNEPNLRHYRNLKIETVPGTIAAINNSLKKLPPGCHTVNGLAIFCDWETDDSEWKSINKNWNIH